MLDKFTQGDLARKFVEKWHLNVAERDSLEMGSLAGTLIVVEICALLEKHGWYPIDWRPDHGFDGGLIERFENGHCQVHWKVEVGVQRFALQEIKAFDSTSDAIRDYALRFFGPDFDGIVIDWMRMR